MRIFPHFLIIFITIIFTHSQTNISSNPYAVLKVTKNTSKTVIEAQYKKLKQKNKKNKKKKLEIQKAYQNIKKQKSNKQKQKPIITSKSNKDQMSYYKDQPYMYGYRFSFQFNDGKHFQAMYNQTQFIIDRSNSSITNKRISAMILLLGSILFKISPCLLLVCLCGCRNSEAIIQNVISRARTVYVPVQRQGLTRR